MNLLKLGAVACVAVLAVAVSTYGTPALSTENFNSDPGWSSSGDGSAIYQSSGGNPAGGGYLQIQFPDQGAGPAMPGTEIVDATSGGFVGDFTTFTPFIINGLIAQFDFEQQTVGTPASNLSLWWTNGGDTWTYSLGSPTAIGTWNNYMAPLYYTGGWQENGTNSTAAAFLADINNVTGMGISVDRNGSTAAQNFGLDNFQLQLVLPEPESVGLILMALLSLGFTFRGKLNGITETIRQHFARK
jgi:hypothetical protein